MNYILKKETIYSGNSKSAIIDAGTKFVPCGNGYISLGGVAIYPKNFVENSPPGWFEQEKPKDLSNQYNGKECELFKVTKIINVESKGSNTSAQYDLGMFAKNIGEIIITKFPPNQREENDRIFLSLELLVIPQPSK